MSDKKYRVVLSREVLVTCPGGSGVLMTEAQHATLLVPDYPKPRLAEFDGTGDTYLHPGPWKIIKMELEESDEG